MRNGPKNTARFIWLRAGCVLSLASGTYGIQSDDFNTCGVDTSLWTVVDPVGDATVSVEGMGSGEAHAMLSIPAGLSHDVWTTYNDTVRLMQPAADGDFEIQTKFDSRLDAGYQMQGILIEQDAMRFLRYDFVHDGSGTFLFAATFSGGSAVIRGNRGVVNTSPLYLSVRRTGNQWTLGYSHDNRSWNTFSTFSFAMAVTRVGPFAGNWSTETAPAVSVRVDYMLDPSRPFAEEDAPMDTPGVRLATSVTGSGAIELDPAQEVYTCGQAVRLTAVPAAGWVFDSWGGALSGSDPAATLTMNTDRSVTAAFVSDAPALRISDVEVQPGTNDAVITWQTSVPASATVVYGPTSAYETGEVRSDQPSTGHSLTLPNLEAGSPYHFAIRCEDQSGKQASTPDATFTTLESSPPAAPLVSDDFSSASIDTNVWTVVNPTGQAALRTVGAGTADARVEISIPAGVYHDAWTNGVNAPWLRQAVPDTDFGMEVKFDSIVDQAWQSQGIIVQEDTDSFLRADFYSDGASVYLYVALLDNGSFRTLVNRSVPAGPPYYLRLVRSGPSFDVQFSKSGLSWTSAAFFNHAMTVSAVGPYVANEGTPAPAFVGLVDYCFNLDSPILEEDGQPPRDTIPPTISGLSATAYQNRIDVTWATDEPADSRVWYGRTAEYELGSVSSGERTADHALSITGLQAGTTYNLAVVSQDFEGNQSVSGNLTATTSGSTGDGPAVDVWYGDTQTFGYFGRPVPRINVLGNASDADGVSSLSYSLNGGASRTLRLGPNTMRLAEAGDFNIDIPFDDLRTGSNTIQIRARDGVGSETLRTISVNHAGGAAWPLPCRVDWPNGGNVNDIAQVIDGLWDIQGGFVRPVVQAYDRLIAIGDISWTNYEVSCPIAVHAIDPNGYAAPSYGPGVGLLVRWPGHANDGGQPWQGVYPLGGIGMFRWTDRYERFEVFGNNGRILASVPNEGIQLGVEYIFKVRVQNVSDGVQYRFKWWPSNQAEPGWRLTGTQSYNDDPGHGCLLLLAHHVDASFGSVSVTPAQ